MLEQKIIFPHFQLKFASMMRHRESGFPKSLQSQIVAQARQPLLEPASGHSQNVEELFMSAIAADREQERLSVLYEALRIKLLDLSKRNRMLNYPLGPRSKRHVQIVDTTLDRTYADFLTDGASSKIAFLEEPDVTPQDEKNQEFADAFERAKITDIEYLSALEGLVSTGRDDEITIERLERSLRDRIRNALGLAPRPKRVEINRAEHARSLGIDPNPELRLANLKPPKKSSFLQTLKYPDELEALMEKLQDEARLAEQEAGLSTLFLAFGFLEWYEADVSDKPLFAPLLLLPVKTERQTIRGKDVYFVAAREGAAETNVSLRKLLGQNFNCALPEYASDDAEEIGSVESYLVKVQESIKGLTGWNVRRWLILGHFAFSRIVMFDDTKPQKWSVHPVQSDLVGSLLKGYEQVTDGDSSPSFSPEDYPIDEPDIERLAPILIQDADASQHSALVDVMKAKNLVLHGPPGTGKSQTITNMIANALAADKTVLFLSEKQAALNVVKRGLDKAGLGEFCLEVHSDKSSSKTVVESLNRRYALREQVATPNFDGQTNAGEFSRRITDYVSALHEKDKDGRTPFKLIWKSICDRTSHRDVLDVLKSVNIPNNILDNLAEANLLHDRLDIFADSAQLFSESHGPWTSFPWRAVLPKSTPIYARDEIIEAVSRLRQTTSELVRVLDLQEGLGIETAADFDNVAMVDTNLPCPPDMNAVAAAVPLNIDELKPALTLQTACIDASTTLASLPPLDDVDTRFLSRASQLRSLLTDPELTVLTPADLYRLLGLRISRARAFSASITALNPAISALGMSGAERTEVVDTVAAAILIAEKIDEGHRPWVGTIDIDEQIFADIYARWAELSREDQHLREAVPSAGDQVWPAARDAATVAAELRKTGLRKLFSARSEKAKITNNIMERFNLDLGAKDAAKIWDRISNHVEAIIAFNGDNVAASALRGFWKGVETPFDELSAGMRWRQYIRSKLGELPQGQRLALVMIALPGDQLSALAEHASAAVSYQANANDFRDVSGEISIDDTLARRKAELLLSKRILGLDVDYALARSKLSVKQLADIYAAQTRLAEAQTALNRSKLAAEVRLVAPGKAEIATFVAAVSWLEQVRNAELPSQLSEGLLGPQAGLWREKLRDAAKSYSQIGTINRLAWSDIGRFSLTGLDVTNPRFLLAQLDNLLGHRDGLTEFLTLMRQREELENRGLDDFLAKCDAAQIAPLQLAGAFDATVTRLLALSTRRSSRPLYDLTGNDLDANRRKFAERDRQKIVVDRELVKAKLMTRKPLLGERNGSVKTWTQMHLLKNEFQKQTRFIPVRRLLDRADDAILALKPCFMMSPLSLAKFMPANACQFDLLIIDEASQMRPEDALGAMLRSKRMVVVGDPKQLPPTNFFDRSADTIVADDEATDDIDDESILERCQKVFNDVRRLKWHYRSRCESLIRFSNEEFYENSLVTFPASKPGAFSIDLIRVNGDYKAIRNVAEAERVAEEAVEFMRYFADGDEQSIPTLGIVAVNINQKDLIQETLRRLSAGDELVGKYMEKTEAKGEPLFVKNLENVQGDERDYIFISMTYGPVSRAVPMLQRFGPIAGSHGHRRLNVLFSRARVHIGLFTSFGSTDIKPTEISKQGVHTLKRYLEYVEARGRMLPRTTGGEPDSDFEIEVAERIRRSGFEVDLQIGVSGFKIDLGVRHPEHPERFLAGVECDGASFHSSKSARDRDRLREQVLRNLGWELVRVWSTDWFDNPDAQTEKLVRRLNEMRKRPVGRSKEYRLKAGYAPTKDNMEIVEPPLGDASGTEPIEDDAEDTLQAVAQPFPPTSASDAAADGAAPMGESDGYEALRHFRETVIKPAMSNWQAHRSILRESMIETFLGQRITNPNEWFVRVPQYLRSGTDPHEKRAYLDQICSIVEGATKNERQRKTGVDGRAPPANNAANIRSGEASRLGLDVLDSGT
jgi:very-short-patch-repair endonuclease/DNA polymerase III delta prime subunit